MKSSLQNRILLGLSGLLLVVVLVFLLMAEQVLKDDREMLVQDINLAGSQRVAQSIEVNLRRIIDKIEHVLALQQLQVLQPERKDLAQGALEQDADLIAMEVPAYRDGLKAQLILSSQKTENLGISRSLIVQALTALHARDGARALSVQNLSTGQNVLYGLKVPLRIGTKTHLVHALFGSRYWRRFGRHDSELSRTIVISEDGHYLLHPDLQQVLHRTTAENFAPYTHSLKSPLDAQQIHFEDNGEKLIGSWERTRVGGMLVVSLTRQSVVTTASLLLLEKTVILTLLVVTVAILAGLFFTASLTRPLLNLVKATEKIATGDLTTDPKLASEIKSNSPRNDEIGSLTASFVRMTDKLQASSALLISSERLAAVGRMSRSIGHEFGNILQPLLTKIETAQDIIKNKELPEETQKSLATLLEEMLTATEHGANICQDLLTFARESQSFGQSPHGPAPEIQVHEVIDKALRLLSHNLKKKDIKLLCNITEGLQVRMNPGELIQVLLNIINNSVHALKDGKTLQARALKHHDRVLIEIEDEGTGIPPEIMSRIFEPNFTTKGEFGNGLGLALSKKLIENIGGRISVRSQLGHGTVITLDLPQA